MQIEEGHDLHRGNLAAKGDAPAETPAASESDEKAADTDGSAVHSHAAVRVVQNGQGIADRLQPVHPVDRPSPAAGQAKGHRL